MRPILFVIAASAIGLLALMPRYLGIYDEGIILTGALRILAGDIPHRDFYANYGPAQFYVTAALLYFFDGSFLAVRAYDILIKASICGLLFGLVRNVCGWPIALTTSAVAWFWFEGLGSHLYPVFPCLPLALAAGGLLAGMIERNARRPAIGAGGAGVCAGLTALFRYDVGFLLAVANLSAVAILLVLADGVRPALRRFLAFVAAYASGICVVFIPAAAAFLAASPLQPFLHDIIEFPLKYYGGMRSLPFPLPVSFDSAIVYLPFAAAALAAIELRQLVRPSSAGAAGDDAARTYYVLFGCMSVVFMVKGIVRVSAIHMLLAAVPSLIVMALVIERWTRFADWRRLAAAVLAILVVVTAAGFASAELLQLSAPPQRSLAGWLVLRAPSRADDACQLGHAAAQLSDPHTRAANYLRQHTRADERVFVGLGRHDKIFVNPVALYYAAGRLPATHWHHFDPGLQTRADVQQDIVSELQRQKVRWVVRDRTFDDVNEPNASAKSSDVRILDDYLDRAYQPAFTAGKVELWLIRGETPPQPAEACVR